MQISAIMAAYSPDPKRSASGTKTIGARPVGRGGDTVEISNEARSRLDAIRKRIDSGYYASERVAEDISDKLTGVLDDIVK